ncbi:MAG: SprT family zinc-dependent metalloprotease [Pseudomonadota bacterium]
MLKRLRRLIQPPAVEQRAIEFDGRIIPYTLKRSARRRSIGLRINDRGLTVSMPQRASEKWLHSVLQDKAGWVIEKLDQWQARQRPVRNWADGETVPFRGELLTLRIRPGLFAAPPQRIGSELVLTLADDAPPDMIAHQVQQWCMRQAEPVFAERLAHFAVHMRVQPKMLKLSSARTQWGSCSARGIVRLNWRLVQLPPRLLDYVVVHELAHLREMNHSAAFWREVEAVLPEWRSLRAELKRYALHD